ncbi:hypothetical protein OPQ81_005339 [Rhizoctonia solani]|nr:hypothetical protein OPQ81_005339 [Rhizoctonia solani]
MVSDVRPESKPSLESLHRFAVATDHQAGCLYLPGTRLSVLTTITSWLNSTNETNSKVLWLADISGSGKSSVAQHIASVAAQTNQLLCSFFFKRDIKAQSSTISVVAQLSRQLARSSTCIAAEASGGGAMTSSGYPEAFHSHITIPLCLHPPTKPSLVVIDALDESGPPHERAGFLSALVHEVPLFPPTVKVLLTSKPSQDIDEALGRLCIKSLDDEVFGYYRLTFDVYGQANRSDISRYISHSFQIVARNKRSKGTILPELWPSHFQRTSLTGHANGLFLLVSVAAAFVDNSENPQMALQELLVLQHRPSPEAAMDALYNHVLQSAALRPGFNLRIYKASLEVVLSAENPLAIQEINSQIHQDARFTLTYLRPVLQCNPEARVIHNSFVEYIQDPHKCDPRFLVSITPRTSERVYSSAFKDSTFASKLHQVTDRQYIESNELPALIPGNLRARDLVADVGSQIEEGSVSCYPITRGGFGDIWSARYIDGREVAIKTLWLHGDLTVFDRQKLEKHAIKELSVWRKLDHPNVLKLLGICALGGGIGMVSEWMPNGNIMQYILNHKDVDKNKLITDVAAGLAYLHENRIIHGDLKGANVVVSASGTARLADFGLAKVVESTFKFSTTSTVKGTVRWMVS